MFYSNTTNKCELNSDKSKSNGHMLYNVSKQNFLEHEVDCMRRPYSTYVSLYAVNKHLILDGFVQGYEYPD